MDLGTPFLDAIMRHRFAAASPARGRIASSVVLLAGVVLLGGCSPAAVPSSIEEGIVLPLTSEPESPTKIDLGEMDASRRIERSLQLENRSRAPVTITRIDASCDCVSFQGALAALEPNQSTQATVVVDLRNDPDFKGLLGVEATGLDASGRQVFAAVICTRVAQR